MKTSVVRAWQPASRWTACFLILALAPLGPAADLFVSPAGNDANPGTQVKPWRTFQRAAGAARPGDIVNLRAGIYRELVNVTVQGTAAARITFQNYKTEHAIITGTGFTPTSNTALIRLANRNYITLRGLEITGLSTSKPDIEVSGISISSSGSYGSNGVEILDCNIHHIRHDNTQPFRDDCNAFGIRVYGYSTAGISNLRLERNQVHDLRLGTSEAIGINGNVFYFQVLNNSVHDCNNNGIDFIGGEGTSTDPTRDRARHGVCRGNQVYNIDSQFNPGYGGNFTGTFASEDERNATRGATAIYSDGGEDIVIEQNTVQLSNIGIEVASENRGATASRCIVRNNLVHHNHVGGLVIGGASSGGGATSACDFLNNTLAYNDTAGYGGGSILIQHNATNCTVRNNLVVSRVATASYQPQFVLNDTTTGRWNNNAIDYNLYAGAPADDLEFIWRGVSKPTFPAWKLVGQDTHSLFSTSFTFLNPSLGNYQVPTNSIVRDKGDPIYQPADQLDYFGRARFVAPRIDIGMSEAP